MSSDLLLLGLTIEFKQHFLQKILIIFWMTLVDRYEVIKIIKKVELQVAFILLLWEFFRLTLADGLSLQSELQQVSSNLQDSSQYSGWSSKWMFITCLQISKSSSSFTNPLGIVLSTPTTIGITVTFMFDSFFSSLARFSCLALFSSSFSFTLWSAGTTNSPIRQFLVYFLLIITRSGRLAEIRSVRLILFQSGFQIVLILLVRMVKFQFLVQFPVDHNLHPVLSSLVLNFFYAN